MSEKTQQAPGNYYPPIEDVELICEFLDRGYSEEQTAMALFDDLRDWYSGRPSDLRHKCRRMVQTVAGDRARWSPYMDQLTMDQAYEGNREAWENLTYYERKAVIERLCMTFYGPIPHPSWPTLEAGEGVYRWAEEVGERGERIKDLFYKTYRGRLDG